MSESCLLFAERMSETFQPPPKMHFLRTCRIAPPRCNPRASPATTDTKRKIYESRSWRSPQIALAVIPYSVRSYLQLAGQLPDCILYYFAAAADKISCLPAGNTKRQTKKKCLAIHRSRFRLIQICTYALISFLN